MVVSDETKSFKDEKQQDQFYRRLACVDLSDGVPRMVPAFAVKVPVKWDPTRGGADIGDGTQGASLVNCVVDLSITNIEQDNRTKQITFLGRVEKVLGVQALQPFKGFGSAETAKKAA